MYNEDKRVEVFTGIPYAQPPVGELRWREPQDAQPWEGVLKADHFAPMSMQPQNSPMYDSLAQIIGYHDYQFTLADNCVHPTSEDSLYLNLWKPASGGEKLPVLVYIHGGSLKTGQPWYQDYRGESLAENGVVAVNIDYRVGVFGFFASDELAAESPNGTTGNYGLLDQIKALEWVRDNIAAFGGDPENVTLAGESAGAACVSALCTSPLAKGLFQRAILESSTCASVHPPHSFRTMDEALKTGRETMAELHCNSISDLRKLSAEELVSYAEQHHHITVDGYALTETPYESYRKGIHNEQAILHGAVFFDYPHYCLNRLAADNGIPVYEYYFTKKNGRLGDWHSGEEVYCYGNIPDDWKLYDSRDRELSAQMLGYWRNFSVNGNPNGSGLPEWAQNKSSDTVMSFGDQTEMTPEREHELFAVLDKMDGWK